VHAREGAVLWCDGEHGFNPYHFAELNLIRGFEADWGADRVLIKRCMTPFQWDTVLNRHLDQKLVETPTSMVIAAPFERLFSTDELKDWEQEDYVEFTVANLRRLARRYRVPVLLSVDMAAWWRTHPLLASSTYEGVDVRWSIARSVRGWRAVEESEGLEVLSKRPRRATLWDFEDASEAVVVEATKTPVFERTIMNMHST
jgi:hypothetical protein